MIVLVKMASSKGAPWRPEIIIHDLEGARLKQLDELEALEVEAMGDSTAVLWWSKISGLGSQAWGGSGPNLDDRED